jgi:hypothetical protein
MFVQGVQTVREYEIRIFQEKGSPPIISWEVQLSAGAAIRSARKMAHGQPFEVWCGMECITGLTKLPEQSN